MRVVLLGGHPDDEALLSAFSNDDSVLIIKHCKQVLVPGGSILLLQTLVPEAGDRSHNTCEDGVAPGAAQHSIQHSCLAPLVSTPNMFCTRRCMNWVVLSGVGKHCHVSILPAIASQLG